jgi:hypothetical protein
MGRVRLGLTYCAVDNHCRTTLRAHEQPAAQSQAIKGFEFDVFTLLLCGHDDIKTYKECSLALKILGREQFDKWPAKTKRRFLSLNNRSKSRMKLLKQDGEHLR